MVIYRSRVSDIVFEFLPPAGIALGVVVICDGLPSVPKQKELMTLLAENGYFVIFPRYRGTWESSGQFLKETPIKDIEQIVNLVKVGEVKELYTDKSLKVPQKPIFLLGSSFGGSIALAFADQSGIDKIIALSPIVNFKQHNNSGDEQDFLRLSEFIHKAFGEAYRFKDEDVKRLASGELFNPPEEIKPERVSDILVIYDKSDDEVDYKKIEAYAEKNNIMTISSNNIGHLSFSKLSRETWVHIFEWLRKK